MVLKNEVYNAIRTDFNLTIVVMQASGQRETTVLRWCRELNDNLLKYPVLKALSSYLKVKKIDDLLEQETEPSK